MKKRDILGNVVTVAMAAAAFGWMIQPIFWDKQEEQLPKTARIVWTEVKDTETEVYGADPETDFTPGVETGGLVISPEDDFYSSIELIAKCVEAEAGNQSLEGKRMVVDVILNRVRDDFFPDTVAGVITEDGAFSVYANGRLAAAEPSEETWQAVRMELEEVGYPGLLYFDCNDYLAYGTPWRQVGDHYFSTR